MIRETTIGLIMGCIALSAYAQMPVPPLSGFKYGAAASPSGREWESPQELGLNKEQPHAWFFSFADVESARRVLPTASSYWLSLDGPWKFNWVGNPQDRPKNFFDPSYDVSGWDDIAVPSCWNVAGLGKDGSQKYGTPVYCNQPVIFQHTVKPGDWKGGVMRTPPQDWTTYKNRNEVGSYRRDFSLPEAWDDREVYIHFDGVNSFFYLYINGRYVGFSKNSRNTASFNITPYLNKNRRNTVAVEVYRNSDGSFLEAQDMFRLPGIFRPVSLTAKPKMHVRDLRVIPDLDKEYINGALTITANLVNLTKRKIKDYKMVYTLYANKLYSDDNEPLAQGGTAVSQLVELKPGQQADVKAVLYVSNVNKWSAEAPYRYTLVGQLQDKKGRVIETVSTYVGFRKIEIKNTPAAADEFGLAGRYYYLNGQPVKLKGVNRQEFNPATGNTITNEQIEQEIMLMKRGNINHVRCSHYSNTPYWYYYCDKYGIYLEDEANLESHEYYYGEASLSHVPEFRDAHVARVMEMARATVNHPSVVIWSLGNEAGPGNNFKDAYATLHAFDPSRPVQYERNNSIVDIGSNQYPSLDWVRGAVTGKYNLKYPFHISEYAHSMGNAGGNLADYWKYMESTNFFMGGAIWDWVDQGLWLNDPETGDRYIGYGGDFGDKPNSGMFCMNGILFPGHKPKPEFYEVRKVYQNVGVRAVDLRKGQIEVFNKNYFVTLDYVEMVWSLWKDGRKVQESNVFHGPDRALAPRQKAVYTIPLDYGALEAGSEYFIKVQFRLAHDEPWAQKGFVQMEEQLPLKAARHKAIADVAQGGPLNLATAAGVTTVSGADFSVSFDHASGTISTLTYNGQTLITPGNGPRISALRAPVDNDNWAYTQWFAKGLYNLKQTLQPGARVTALKQADGSVTVSMPIMAQAPCAGRIEGGTSGRYVVTDLTDQPFDEDDFRFMANQVYTVYPDGSIELRSSISSNDASVVLPRLGYEMQLPEKYSRYTYYGRGPENNYVDRQTGYFIEQYESTVKDQFVNFPKPQSMGNREDVRWCALTTPGGEGIQFISLDSMSASALPYSALEMTLAPHPHQLPRPSGTHLHLDCAVTGLGGNSCGQGGPYESDRVKATVHDFGFIIRPVSAGADLTARAAVAGSSVQPISIARDRAGKVTISGEPGLTVLYTYGRQKAQTYSAPFDARQGGDIIAWYANNAGVSRTKTSLSKMEETVPTEVIYASSQETGDPASNLTDGNPATMWHTMYSVTVAQYPHWVDFDAGTPKLIKGFTYLPRQDGSANGVIKGWKIQVSDDGKNWSGTVAQGEFKGNKEQRVTFSQPVRTRYVRFTALSAQNGADYASGAEFSLIAE